MSFVGMRQNNHMKSKQSIVATNIDQIKYYIDSFYLSS